MQNYGAITALRRITYLSSTINPAIPCTINWMASMTAATDAFVSEVCLMWMHGIVSQEGFKPSCRW